MVSIWFRAERKQEIIIRSANSQLSQTQLLQAKQVFTEKSRLAGIEKSWIESISGKPALKVSFEDGLITPSFMDLLTIRGRLEPGNIPRPTDQRVNFSLCFQDDLPMNPTYKMHLMVSYGSGLSFGPPNSPKYKHFRRLPSYRREDIGFSKQLKSEESRLPQGNIFRHFKSIWLSLEIFNVLQISNTISYIWVKDIYNREYVVPNYLTPRQLNLRLMALF